MKESGIPPGTKLTVWTSTLKRTIQTSRHLIAETKWDKLEWKALDELDSGVCDGLTYAEIEDQYPEDFKARDQDKYNYRYRGGESYRDVVIRLEPIIMELERSENILIVTHQAIVRCIYAYFMDIPQERSPWMEVPLHTLMKLTPRAYGTHEERFQADIPAVSTWREKGSSAKHQASESEAHRTSMAEQLHRESLRASVAEEAAKSSTIEKTSNGLSTTSAESGGEGGQTTSLPIR